MQRLSYVCWLKTSALLFQGVSLQCEAHMFFLFMLNITTE